MEAAGKSQFGSSGDPGSGQPANISETKLVQAQGRQADKIKRNVENGDVSPKQKKNAAQCARNSNVQMSYTSTQLGFATFFPQEMMVEVRMNFLHSPKILFPPSKWEVIMTPFTVVKVLSEWGQQHILVLRFPGMERAGINGKSFGFEVGVKGVGGGRGKVPNPPGAFPQRGGKVLGVGGVAELWVRTKLATGENDLRVSITQASCGLTGKAKYC